MAKSSDVRVEWGQPAWTAPMYQPSTGMDHLGLASVSQDRILPELAPGINVQTVHPRYWSVYVWLLTEFWDRDLPRTKAAWGRFIKPRERVFVAAVMSCPRHGSSIPQVAGKDRVGREVDAGADEFNPGDPYLKDARGGYPIYASAIAQLGLSVLDRDTAQFDCDAPTEQGRQIGLTLREWVSGTRYYRDHFDDTDTPVPAKVVKEYAEKICLCRLTDGPDHPLLEDAFLHGGEPAEAERRRASLRLICDLSAQTTADSVSPWQFRLFGYYRSDDVGRKYQPSSNELLVTARRWRLYQHREFVAWAFNRWLRRIHEWGVDAGGDQVPIPLEEVLATVDDADFAGLASALGCADPHLGPKDEYAALVDWARGEGRVNAGLDDAWDRSAPLTEELVINELWDLSRFDDDVTAGVMALLSLCAARLWPREYQLQYANDWSLVRAGGARRLAVDRFIEDMRTQVRSKATIGEVGRWLLEYYVVRQHHRVALAKLPDDTFRFRLDAGRVRFVDETVAVEMNDSRYRSLSTCAAEIGWTRPLDQAGHGLTRTGRQLVKAGDVSTSTRARQQA